MTSDAPLPGLRLRPSSFDSALGQKIIELNVWAVRQGLNGAPADLLLGGFCRRLVEAGVPLWRAFAGLRTLHPQWGLYAYTWQREANAVEPAQLERGGEYDKVVATSPSAN